MTWKIIGLYISHPFLCNSLEMDDKFYVNLAFLTLCKICLFIFIKKFTQNFFFGVVKTFFFLLFSLKTLLIDAATYFTWFTYVDLIWVKLKAELIGFYLLLVWYIRKTKWMVKLNVRDNNMLINNVIITC